MVAVRWYLRYAPVLPRASRNCSGERGVEVDHVTVYRWVQRFTPLLADAARFTHHAPGDRWFVDETDNATAPAREQHQRRAGTTRA